MTEVRSGPQTTRRGRRAGYVVGLLVNLALLWFIHVWPGWQSVSFLTADTAAVLGLVDAALIVGAALDVAYLFYEPRWFTALGGCVTTAIGLAAIARLLQVFPFSFDPSGFDWALVVRVLLIVGLVGSAIGLLVGLVTVVRELGRPTRTAPPAGGSAHQP